MCGVRRFSSVGGSLEPSGEGDRERVERGLPPHHPACPSASGGVKRACHEVETLQRGLLVREVPAGADRAPIPCVDRLDRVCGADHSADLDVVEPVAEWRIRASPVREDLVVGAVGQLDDSPGGGSGLGGVDLPNVVGGCCEVQFAAGCIEPSPGESAEDRFESSDAGLDGRAAALVGG